MDLQQLRNDITAGVVRLIITQHARTEGLKDGLSRHDLRSAAMRGDVMEDYPDRDQVLLLDFSPHTGFPAISC